MGFRVQPGGIFCDLFCAVLRADQFAVRLWRGGRRLRSLPALLLLPRPRRWRRHAAHRFVADRGCVLFVCFHLFICRPPTKAEQRGERDRP